MKTLRHTPLQRAGLVLVLAGLAGSMVGPAAATTPLADQPVFTNTGVPGNLALALSVEFPTAVSVAHTGNTYSSANNYLGYFDPKKCYLYSHSATEADRHFYPAGAATTDRTCTGTNNDKWSGNFLNWATMQTVDPFRWALTGGYRVRDTTTETFIEKAWASGQGGEGNFPKRSLGTAVLVQENTPLDAWGSLNMRIHGLGNKMRFTITGGVDNAPTAYKQGDADGATVYEVSVRVKVCDTNVTVAGPLESNCTAYPNGSYKPTGLIQQYAERIRYSAFGYLNDGNIKRDGGVLRARQKFVGPTQTIPTLPATANPGKEWDPETGIIYTNPDSTDASDTATLFGTAVPNSGVINYLNKFGQSGSYKTYDPVGELYYAAIRYFKNLGNVPEWSAKSADNGTNGTWVDGFPVITTWNDPIEYSCQKNFVLGIGDVNTHADKNVPGTTGSANEPTKPSMVTADTTVDSVAATNKVGSLHGLGASAGTTENWGGCCNNNSALMAGIAYDANTKDIRPDNAAVAKTKGKQTVQTYWLDILEYQNYKANNQFYLAAKYGGFKAPETFDPYTRATDIPKEWWSTTGEATPGGQDRPDTYFTADKPAQMVAGLTRTFKDIGSKLTAFTTSFATALPQVTLAGAGSYASKYDASTWSGEVIANATSFDAVTGTPSLVEAWSFSAKLGVQIAGTGWDTNRRVITWNTSSKTGVPFRTTGISGAQLATLNTIYRDGDDSADYLNYLRGDPSYEVGSAGPATPKIYRARGGPVGDIVGSKVEPVGGPTAPFSAATNAGYATFRSTWKDRAPMLYVGSNAGMLHAIKASVKDTDTDRGTEVFAYIPGVLYQGANGVPIQTGLQHRGDPDFTHKNMVDGPIVVFDIDLGKTPGGSGTPDWRSVLVGAMGKGGKAYFAIDVTDPSAFSSETAAAGKVMWEFTHADLGYTYGEPAVVKTKKYGWVLIFGSGHNNADGVGYIFIVNPRTGALLEKISTGAGAPGAQAGLSQVQAYLPDRTDFTAETLYAGDLLGNLWRLDLTPTTGAYASPTKIAVLTDSTGATVPVTSRPLVVIQPKTNRRYVTVGSGKLLANSDIGNSQPQGFYAIIDGTGNQFNTAATLPAGMTFPIRNAGADNRLLKLTDLTQKITLDLATQIGWWLDLGTATGGTGWRVISDSTAFLGTIAFAAMAPTAQVCEPSGNSRVYAIDLGSGESVLRTNLDAILPFNDSLSGVITDLRFYSVNGKLRLVGGTDTGAIGSLKVAPPPGTGIRRLNWRELQLAD